MLLFKYILQNIVGEAAQITYKMNPHPDSLRLLHVTNCVAEGCGTNLRTFFRDTILKS